jgi:hypothetical protein
VSVFEANGAFANLRFADRAAHRVRYGAGAERRTSFAQVLRTQRRGADCKELSRVGQGARPDRFETNTGAVIERVTGKSSTGGLGFSWDRHRAVASLSPYGDGMQFFAVNR